MKKLRSPTCLPVRTAGVMLFALVPAACAGPAATGLARIGIAADGNSFVETRTGTRFVCWGFNYDHDGDGRLIEDYWHEQWDTVVADFREMKDLGANVVRIHLQTGRFMKDRKTADPRELQQLAALVTLAERTGLYLDITGLGCYHKQDVPAWYDALAEQDRWAVQGRFWEAVARTCAGSDAVFCYDLINEPIVPGRKKVETEWLAGELGGKHFVQRIALDLAGRERQAVVDAWVAALVAAIRKHDRRHLITVGIIPWALAFYPHKIKPLFYSGKAGEMLDFVSVHFYPKKDKVKEALEALRVYEMGTPLVIEEMFPLKCGVDELDRFIDGSRDIADGYIGFYWGTTPAEYAAEKTGIAGAIKRAWLEYFRAKGPKIKSR